MKNDKKIVKDELRPEYKRSDFPGGLVRGKYSKRMKEESNIIVLKPEVAKVFPNEEAVAYVFRDNPPAAVTFRKKAEKTLSLLKKFPESGRPISEFSDLPFVGANRRKSRLWLTSVLSD